MTWEAYYQTALGIAVSVVLFVLSYRQTIGAYKERANIASREIVQTLVRLVVLEQYEPTLAELTRLINSKARDGRIRRSSLPSEEAFIETVYSRILESDFIPAQQRPVVTARLARIAREAGNHEADTKSLGVAPLNRAMRKVSQNGAALTLIFLTATAGAMVAAYSLPTGTTLLSSAGLLVSTLFFSGLAWFFIKYREGPTEQRGAAWRHYYAIEAICRQLGGTIRFYPHKGADIILEYRGKRIALETRHWSRRPGDEMLLEIVDALEDVMAREDAIYGLIVTDAVEGELPGNPAHVRMVTTTQLRAAVEQLT